MRGNRVPVVSVGMNVTHRTYGLGKVVGEWGPIPTDPGNPKSIAPCSGIFDVVFHNRSGSRFLHCARKEFLTPIY
jgi:hypothetical protein